MTATPRLLGAACLLIGWSALAQPAAAETVYRCGPDGRSYSSTPCPGGKAVVVADPRDAQQRDEGRQVAERERQLAARLGAERAQRERDIVPATAGELGPRPTAAAASAARRAKHTGGDPPRPPKQKKHKRKAAPKAAP